MVKFLNVGAPIVQILLKSILGDFSAGSAGSTSTSDESDDSEE